MEIREARKRYVELTTQKRGMEAEMRKLNDELSKLQEIILEDFTESGMNKCSVDGMTLYLSEIQTVKVIDKTALRQALLANGFEDLLSCNANTLRSLVNSYEEEAGKPLPEDIAAAVERDSVFRLNARKESNNGE